MIFNDIYLFLYVFSLDRFSFHFPGFFPWFSFMFPIFSLFSLAFSKQPSLCALVVHCFLKHGPMRATGFSITNHHSQDAHHNSAGPQIET